MQQWLRCSAPRFLKCLDDENTPTVATMPPNSHQINVATLPDGVYTLLAKGNGNKYYERVVVLN